MKNKKNPPGISVFLLLVFLGTISAVVFLGGVSFARRYLNLLFCSYNLSKDCNRNLMLSISQGSTQGESKERLSLKRVAFSGLIGGKIWTWSADNFLETFLLNDETRYGIAVLMEDNKFKKGRMTSMLQSGQLAAIETPIIDINGKTLLIENPPQTLTQENFKAIVKGGNLLQIIYNRNTRAMIGILLLDFSRI